MGEYFEFQRFIERIPQIVPYIRVTLSIVFISMLLGTILGIAVASVRIKKIPVIHQILDVYISFMRGTPLLIQMMIVFYGLPLLADFLFGININRWDTLIFVNIAIILNEGAFLGEIFKSSILAVPRVQTEAGYSIGMTGAQVFFRIVLPQSIKIAIPPYGVDLIGVLHNTSLVYVLGVIDILGRAKSLGNATSHALEGYLVVSAIYIIVSLLLKAIFLLIEKKMNYGKEVKVHGV